MKATVLVSGAGGFVGSAILRKLVWGQEHDETCLWDGSPVEEVVALVRPGGSLERLEEVVGHGAWSVAEVDLSVGDELRAVLRRVQPRAIVHAALDLSACEEGGDADDRANIAPVECFFDELGAAGSTCGCLTSSGATNAPRVSFRILSHACPGASPPSCRMEGRCVTSTTWTTLPRAS